ncbi:MAG: hypothetical protein JST89_12355 [Cyanobacteria bacterium SZAS-4]|nr:hypothetical protein [Cyanobacteria bacterium SZAS-4]
MFDFIKRMFGGGKRHSQPRNATGLDVVEGNDIEILKTSDYSEGVPGSAIDKLVAEHELPPAGIDLMIDQTLPEAELDEPSAEPDTVPVTAEPDNYLLGNLDEARKQRAMQTSRAGMQYWSDGLMKYRPRSQRPSVDGSNAKQFNYFEVLRDEPLLRRIELQHPGMGIDHLNLQRFINKSLKGKMVSEYVLRSLALIRDQNESGVIPTYNAAGNSDMRDAHSRTLRDLFNAYEADMQARRTPGRTEEESSDAALQVDSISGAVDEILSHFEEMFEHSMEDENEESYRRWLLSVAEDATASDDILWLLVEDPNPDVRFCLAENYNIDKAMLEALSEDENPYVAHRAQKTMMRLQSPVGKVVDSDFGSGNMNRFRKSG